MRVLVAGYGNCYRQDDRAGHVLAPMIHQWLENQGISVELYLDLKLLPEMVFYFSGFDHVVFIDANAQPLKHGFSLKHVVPDTTPPGADLHVLSPGKLLALLGQLDLPQPAGAYLLSVSGHSFDFSEELTPQCTSRIIDAFAAFTNWWETHEHTLNHISHAVSAG